jgi:hypothetical protein
VAWRNITSGIDYRIIQTCHPTWPNSISGIPGGRLVIVIVFLVVNNLLLLFLLVALALSVLLLILFSGGSSSLLWGRRNFGHFGHFGPFVVFIVFGIAVFLVVVVCFGELPALLGARGCDQVNRRDSERVAALPGFFTSSASSSSSSSYSSSSSSSSYLGSVRSWPMRTGWASGACAHGA